MMLPALVRPGDASLLFLSGLSTALYSRLSQCYAAVAKNRNRGWSLTPAELDRAKGLLNENLDGDISLSVIARECQLPVIHFAEAFRRATGLAPHRWLAAQRVASAKRLLARGQRDLAYIASVCGFTNERQMERQFIALVGLTPSHWQNDHIQR
jgi:AraC-like DNA-binding protein